MIIKLFEVTLARMGVENEMGQVWYFRMDTEGEPHWEAVRWYPRVRDELVQMSRGRSVSKCVLEL